MTDVSKKRKRPENSAGTLNKSFARPKDEVEEEIEGLLCASQRPFDSRLEALIYIFLAEDTSQERAQRTAKDLAEWIEAYMEVSDGK